ncbi:MAG TPA: 4-hydroxythreonine-4-phosphate dehydrogenase PdxA [Acidobacteriota bacterium]|nr:4-hydroxythreonine-4-phosphate dehydrogenase PdxA [Acidobacteriota bacterium]
MTRTDEGPPVALTMGDPAGIGPEVLLKALGRSEADFRPVIFGAANYLRSLDRDLGTELDWSRIELVSTGDFPYPPSWGKVSRDCGQLAMEALSQASRYCRDGGAHLLVTAPVNKEALHLAGFPSPGQTEFVASFFGESRPSMAFFSDPLNVLLATTHIPLRDVPDSLSAEDLVRRSEQFREALYRLLGRPPLIAVCGLNPHASEGGLFGDEEETVVKPALDQLRRRFGPDAFSGPYPADTVFWKAIHAEFDGVVALYHDQGLIPVKLLAFDRAVNVTLGLPIVRTSPDHGTAFDIAGSNQADPGSMVAAIEYGLKLTAHLRRPA